MRGLEREVKTNYLYKPKEKKKEKKKKKKKRKKQEKKKTLCQRAMNLIGGL